MDLVDVARPARGSGIDTLARDVMEMRARGGVLITLGDVDTTALEGLPVPIEVIAGECPWAR